MEAKTISIGIDLGTTNSVMARIERKEARVLFNQDSEQLTASVVHITESGDVVVGKEARAYGGRDPENTVFSIKRYMGRNFEDPVIQQDIQHAPYRVQRAKNGEVEVILRGQAYSPARISSFILAQMKKDAEVATDQEVTHAVITVPAYFGNRQRKTTRMAGQMAGLNVLRIVPEPTAAALAYGFEAGMDDPKTVLVYDLGGGTFDVTVMSIVAGHFIDMGKTGDMHLGGDDFDQKIMDWIIQQVSHQNNVDLRSLPNAPEVLYNLKYVAEQAKIRLGRTNRTQILLPSAVKAGNRQIDLQCELTRDQFNQMIRPLVQHSIDLVYEAITKANNTVNEIDAILLVGGSTKVPLVEELLREVFGEKVIHGNVNPMHCVAQGAAFHTQLPPEVVEGPEEDPELEEEEKAHPQGGEEPGPVVIPGPKQEVPLPEKECPGCGRLNPGNLRECQFCGESLTGGIQEVHEKIPVPIGVQVEGDQFEIMLDDNMYYPTLEPVIRPFRTTRPGQEHVRIPIYEGWKMKASENNFLGEAEGQLPAGLPENTQVVVSISLDASGILYVTASLPDKPGEHIKARMDWKNRVETPGQPGGESGGQGGEGGGDIRPPADWRDDARGTLNRAGLILKEAQTFMSDDYLENLRRLGSQLNFSIETNDATNGKALMQKIEPEIQKGAIFMVLGFARQLSEDPDLSVRVGFQNADQLSKAIARADHYKLNREWENFVKVMDSDVMTALAPYMEVLGGTPTGQIPMDDLLRASSTSQLGNI